MGCILFFVFHSCKLELDKINGQERYKWWALLCFVCSHARFARAVPNNPEPRSPKLGRFEQPRTLQKASHAAGASSSRYQPRKTRCWQVRSRWWFTLAMVLYWLLTIISVLAAPSVGRRALTPPAPGLKNFKDMKYPNCLFDTLFWPKHASRHPQPRIATQAAAAASSASATGAAQPGSLPQVGGDEELSTYSLYINNIIHRLQSNIVHYAKILI